MSTSTISHFNERTRTSAHVGRIRTMEYFDMLNGVLVMGSFIGYCVVIWYLIFKIITVF